MEIPTFHTKEEMFKFLKENKSILIAEKKLKTKEADSINYSVPVVNKSGEAIKDVSNSEIQDIGLIKAKVIINTTGLLDSHGDVHIKGIWKKSLSEKKNLYLLQEHQMKFDKIITDKVKASAVNYTWKDLGFSFEGSTEALQFDCEVYPERNEFMYNQYVKGYVNNHSVGMQYVTMFLCINSDSKYYIEEKENFDKYIKQVANKEVAEELGYFWAVTEAKVIEGSAVVIGSNYATPTISITQSKHTEPPIGTHKEEPVITTQKTIDYNYLSNNLK